MTLDPSTLTVAVVPVLVGPLQVLLALLPAVLAAAGGALLGLFRPSAMKTGLRLLWRLKLFVLGAAAVVVASVYGLRAAFPSGGEVVGIEATDDAWPMFRGGPGRTGSVPGTPGPSSSGMNWAFTGTRTFYSSPAVVGNRVYIASADLVWDTGAIICLDADTGGVAWTGGPRGYRATFSSPSVSGRYLVCGEGLHDTTDARIVCLDVTKRGELLWEYRTKSHVESSPCIVRDGGAGRVYVGAGDDGYYCLDLEPDDAGRARVLWHAEGERFPDAETSPVVYAGRVYVGLGEKGNAVSCLDAKTGEELWRVETPFPVFAPPAVAGSRLIVGMGNGNFIQSAEKLGRRPAGEVWCIDLRTHEVAWRAKVGRTVLGAAAVGEGRACFGSRDGKLYSVAVESGRVLGSWDARAAIVTSPALSGGHVYFVTERGTLFALERETLEPAWSQRLGTEGNFISSPAVARGRVYVGTTEYGLLCVGSTRAAEGETIWSGARGGAGSPGTADFDPLPDRGSLIWRYPRTGAPTSVTAPPACVGDRLLVPLAGGRPSPRLRPASVASAKEVGERKGLLCLRLAKEPRQPPKEVWLAGAANAVTLSPAATATDAYFVDGAKGDEGRRLRSVDIGTGDTRWEVEVEPDASGEFALYRDGVFVQDGARRLAHFGTGGEKRWHVEAGELRAVPAREGAILVVATASPPALGAMDAPTGRWLWRKELDRPPRTGAPVRRGTIYLGAGGGVCAFKLLDGSPLWESSTGAASTELALDGRHVAYVSAASELVLLERENGEAAARVAGATPGAPPLLGRDRALFVSGGNLMGVTLPSGEPRRWMAASWLGGITSPMVAAGSRVYFGTGKMGLVCAGKWR